MSGGALSGPAQSDAALLRLEDVTRAYETRGELGFRLAPLTLDVLPGAWIGISGRSGAGKTTLLNLLSGLDRPDTGRVWMFGAEVGSATDAELAIVRRDQLGIVHQEARFIDHLPVWNNVTTSLVPAGVPSAERRERAADLLERLEVENALERLPGELSGGEKQRVAFARAVVREPRVLIADEPTASVDAATAEVVVEFLRALHAAGTALVVGSHDELVLAASLERRAMTAGVLAGGTRSVGIQPESEAP